MFVSFVFTYTPIMTFRLILFALLNFGALAIGGFFTGSGVTSEWYANLNKAPWTPPGWVFGAAWTVIMVCFTIYMSMLYPRVESTTKLLILFSLQWLLNVLWNPVFFHFQFTFGGLILILALTLLVFILLTIYWKNLGMFSLFILPYGIWLCIASSLNWYILLKN